VEFDIVRRAKNLEDGMSRIATSGVKSLTLIIPSPFHPLPSIEPASRGGGGREQKRK